MNLEEMKEKLNEISIEKITLEAIATLADGIYSAIDELAYNTLDKDLNHAIYLHLMLVRKSLEFCTTNIYKYHDKDVSEERVNEIKEMILVMIDNANKYLGKDKK